MPGQISRDYNIDSIDQSLMQAKDNRINNAISALTYGLNCLVLEPNNNRLHDCIVSVHEEYINILHLIISKKVSYLLKLHEIYNITDNEFSTESKLKSLGISYYLILYTQSLDSFTFAFKTQFQRQTFRIAIVIFVRQAKLYYDRLNEFDPFKAEAMMTFLEADKDGGNLLDIEEIENILASMRIIKDTQEIFKDIQEINKILYEHQKIKRPKGMKDSQLNQLGFQYLLRFYTIKEDLAKVFRQYCSQYKFQTRNSKVSLVDIVRYNENPIMSPSQLQAFYQKMLFEQLTEEQCMNIIESFPVYDAEGKERPEKQQLINFNNFCSLLSSKRNSAFMEESKEMHQAMTHPLSDYYISSDFSDYSLKADDNQTRINQFELSLKRGVRCLHFHLKENKKKEPILANQSEKSENLQELLKIIALKGFQFNQFPIILKIQHNGISKTALDKTAQIITEVFQDQLYQLPPNFQEHDTLPSPLQLKKKILIMANVNSKLFKGKEKQFPDQSHSFFKIVSLFATKLDFQRKGQFAWNFCALEHDKLEGLEDVEDENMSNYTKKIMVKVGPTFTKGIEVNKSTSLYLRLGVQVIGLTFKNINEQNYYVQSLFLENGGAKCGYLLKPSWMCLKNPKNQYAKNFDTPLYQLTIRVLSGQNCIINQFKQEKRQENIYVQVYLKGNKKEEEVNKRAKSPIQQPGYYVQFNLECNFTIYCNDLATVVLIVRGETTNRILSGRAVPVRHLKQGLHPVYLLGNHFKQSVSSYLFVYSERKAVPKKTAAYLQPTA